MGITSDAYQTAGSTASGVGESVSARASAARDTVAGTASSARETVAGTASSAVGTVRSAPETVRRRAEGNPLAAGLIACGAGWLLSSLLPASEPEQRVASQVKDFAAEQGRPVAGQLGGGRPAGGAAAQGVGAATRRSGQADGRGRGVDGDRRGPFGCLGRNRSGRAITWRDTACLGTGRWVARQRLSQCDSRNVSWRPSGCDTAAGGQEEG